MRIERWQGTEDAGGQANYSLERPAKLTVLLLDRRQSLFHRRHECHLPRFPLNGFDRTEGV